VTDRDKLIVGVVQMAMSDDVEDNTARAEALVRRAARDGAGLICLPELFRSRYFCQTEDYERFALAEPVPGPTTERFAALAAELDVTVVLSLFEERAPGLYHNTAAVVDGAHGYLGKYRKMHIPDDPRYYEKFYFTPGDLGFKVFPTGPVDLGVLVCWDQWYPEAARLTALMGRRCSSIPPPSAGIRRSAMSWVRPSTAPGRPSSAATPSPMAASWWPPTASVSSPIRAAAAVFSSGARASWSAPMG
jgi:predicted amidohydrolase